jgi:Bacterial Ig domain/Gametolysin peptidase M11
MYSRCPSGQLPPAPPSFSRLSRSTPRLMLAGFLVLGMVLCAAAGLARAQNTSPSGPNPAAERLTQDLVALNARYHRASPAEQAQLLGDLLTAAADRQQLLATLIENSPDEVLRVALPAAIRASLPPAVQAYVEEEVEVEGELEVMYEDYDQDSRLLYFLEAAGEQLSLHFAADPPTDLLTGAQVRVKGVQVDGALALESGETSIETLALAPSSTSTATTATIATSAALPNTFGAQKTLVILVNFQDNTTQPYTVSDARSVVFGETSDFLYENSYQQTWLTGDVAGWYTIPFTSTVCDISSIATYAQAAASAAGFNLAAYTHYVYAFPQNACGGEGMGTLGGNPSQVWINGSGMSLKVVSHELGHSFGLYHAHSLECGTSVLGTGCSLYEYGDRFDTMGNTFAGHYNAFQKERLGWLDYGVSPAITTVQASGLYTIEPLEATGASPKALAILKSTDPTTGQQTWYYVEYRQALGFDAFLATNSNMLNGIVVHTGSPSNGDSSTLLDMTPASGSQNWSDWSDPALDVSLSFSDPTAGVTLTLLSVDGATASISVTLSNQAPIAVNDSATTVENTSVTIPVLANDSDPDGDPLTVVSVTQGASGTVSRNSDGTVSYLPTRHFKGTDSFHYQITDGTDTATATVTVTVVKKTGGGKPAT